MAMPIWQLDLLAGWPVWQLAWLSALWEMQECGAFTQIQDVSFAIQNSHT
jgi:hypothetical protein